jgi:hypothetical protein
MVVTHKNLAGALLFLTNVNTELIPLKAERYLRV